MSKDYLYRRTKIFSAVIILIGILIQLFSYSENINYLEKLISILNNNWFMILNFISIVLIVFRAFTFYRNIYFKQRTIGIVDSKLKVLKSIFSNCIFNCIFAIGLSIILTLLIKKFSFDISLFLIYIKYILYFIIVNIFLSSALILFTEYFDNRGFIISSIILLVLVNCINLNLTLLEVFCLVIGILLFNAMFLYVNGKKE